MAPLPPTASQAGANLPGQHCPWRQKARQLTRRGHSASVLTAEMEPSQGSNVMTKEKQSPLTQVGPLDAPSKSERSHPPAYSCLSVRLFHN